MAHRAPVASLFASLANAHAAAPALQPHAPPPPGLAAAEARTLSLLATLHAASAARSALAAAGPGTVAIAACIACESLPQPIPQSAFEKQSGLRPAAFRASLAELRAVLAQSRAAASAASSPRTPSRSQGGAEADADAPSGSRKRPAPDSPAHEERSPAALRARAAAVQSGAAWGLQRSGSAVDRTPSKARSASEEARSEPGTPLRAHATPSRAHATPSRSHADSAASTPRSVRFGPDASDADEPQTPSRGAAAKTLFPPLPHTPSRGSRLRPTEELEEDADEPLAAPPPADDGEREYAFELYPRLRGGLDDEDRDAVARSVEHWKSRLAASAALGEGEWDADGWGSLPLAAQ